MPREVDYKETNIVIENREQLSYMLCEAATLEHMVMCGYLYSVFTMKQSSDEGVTEFQLKGMKRWERVISNVSAQEMLHLALVNNLLTSIGAAPYFDRPNFPHRAKYFSTKVQLGLLPFGEQALRHFLYLERPEGMSMKAVIGFDPEEEIPRSLTGEEIVPEKQDFATVGHLYRGIQQGFWDLCDRYGQERVFLGSPKSQATQEHFGWPELNAVTDLDSAMKAIDTIITEGEGAKGEWKKAHFGKFYDVLNEFLELKKENRHFAPARPAVPAYVRMPIDVENVELIKDPNTARAANVFNASYEVLLQILSRFFVQVDTNPSELIDLSNAAFELMIHVISPMGKIITRMPLGPHRQGKTAGPCFEMYQRNYLLPQQSAAKVIVQERLLEISDYCSALKQNTQYPELAAVEQNLRNIADGLLSKKI